MFQQAFGFVQPAPYPEGLSPKPEGPAPSRGPNAPVPKPPFPNFARLTTIRERLARLRTASHTPPQASSPNNASPSRSTGCASTSLHPLNDAAPALLRIAATPQHTPLNLNRFP